MNRSTDKSAISSDTFSDVDPEVVAILDEYLASIEQGKSIELEALLSRRPDRAVELKAYLDSIQFLHLAARELQSPEDSLSVLDWTGRTLGEYEIVRELGRGGMGVVYEATQSKLGRRVALKVLPLAAVLDKQQTARFMLEAQAAAQMSHPNIVPVYGVGCERGVHYYSMQYIEGQSLESAIQELKQFQRVTRRDLDPQRVGEEQRPSDAPCRFSSRCSIKERNYIAAVAQLGIQAAEALQHAHDFGIVHRDIKPSNLIIDREGKLWVTDFGLARCQADSSITLTGAILGTVRYMSPEQAEGRRAMVDHRTDIYSLGGTLYELLTLRTAYQADHTHDLLRQIECREPTPLRRLNPSIPVDLETIVLKAISRQPGHRYGTASEFANDLQRFISGKPITARRPSLADRTAKWATRHKNLVAAAVVISLLALVGASAAVLLILREQSATQAALSESQRNLERSQEHFRQSREVLDHFGIFVVDRLGALPGTERVRNELLLETLRYYDRFIAQASDDPTLQADLAVACFKSGEILDRLGAGDKAIASYERARGIFERRKDAAVRPQIAACHNNIGLVLASQGNVDAAKKAYTEAIRQYEHHVAADPTMGSCCLQLAAAYGNLAALLNSAGQRSDALTYHDRALALQQKLVKDHPQRVEFRREFAITLNNLSYFHRDSDLKQSIDLNQQAVELLQEITSADPDHLDYQSDLALSFTNQGSLLASSGDYAQAEAAYREGIKLYKSLLRKAPNVFTYRRDLAVAHNNLGRTLTELEQFSAAIAALEEAKDGLRILSGAAPDNLLVLSSLGGVFNNLGSVYEHTHDYGQAVEAYEQAVALQQTAMSRAPKVAQFADLLKRTRENHARALVASGQSEDDAGVRFSNHSP